MKNHSHKKAFNHSFVCLAVFLGLLLGMVNSARSMPFVRASPPPVFYMGFEAGYELNAFSNLTAEYSGSFAIDNVPVEVRNHFYVGLVSDYYLNDPEHLKWLLSTKVLLQGRSFNAAAAGVELPLELQLCGGMSSGAGHYRVAIENTELNISTVLNRKLDDSQWILGIGVSLGITRFFKRYEFVELDADASAAANECRIAATGYLVPSEEGTFAQVRPSESNRTLLDPRLVFSVRYFEWAFGDYLLTPVIAANVGLLPIGSEELRWRQSSVSLGVNIQEGIF